MSDMHAELEMLIDRISADLTDQALYLDMERGAWPAALAGERSASLFGDWRP